jgi:hypothetical protein
MARTLSQPPSQPAERESSQHGTTGTPDETDETAGDLNINERCGIAADTEVGVPAAARDLQDTKRVLAADISADDAVEVAKLATITPDDEPYIEDLDDERTAQDGMAAGTEQRASIAHVTEQYYELLEESDVEDWRQLLQDIETLSPESR